MDFQQRFKGRMAIIKKEGIDRLISAGGIPIKAGGSNVHRGYSMSFQGIPDFEDEVDLYQNTPDNRFYSNASPSPKHEIVKFRSLNSSSVDNPFPERPIESASPVFNGALRHKKFMVTPIETKIHSSVESRKSSIHSAQNYRNFFSSLPKSNQPLSGLLRHQNSKSLIYNSTDFDAPSPLHSSPKAIDVYTKNKRDSLLKDNNSAQSSIMQLGKLDGQDLTLRKLNSLGSKRVTFGQDVPKYKVRKELLNKIVMKNTNNISVLLDRQNSNSQLYNKIVKSKLHRINDNQFRFEKMAALFNKESTENSNNSMMKQEQGNGGKEPRSLIDKAEEAARLSKEFVSFKKERTSYPKYVVLPKIK